MTAADLNKLLTAVHEADDAQLKARTDLDLAVMGWMKTVEEPEPEDEPEPEYDESLSAIRDGGGQVIGWE